MVSVPRAENGEELKDTKISVLGNRGLATRLQAQRKASNYFNNADVRSDLEEALAIQLTVWPWAIMDIESPSSGCR